TGLVSYLAGIKDSGQLKTHPLKGALFESFVISEFLKYQYNRGKESNLYYWRDKTGHEIDCILEESLEIIPIEIKSGRTITTDYFKNLKYWCGLADIDMKKTYIVYGGLKNQKRSNGNVVRFNDCIEVMR
ncbi:MAG: DUF4143 domain-containing protein, partial [Candidatus Omnitrophica bacterium]|nr:DUF4143 domain-containing protein [Candidatus Omnitrophota bacterium]